MYQEVFLFDSTNAQFISQSPANSGTYSLSVISLRTAFSREDTARVSEVFQEFIQNREAVLARIQAANPNQGGDYNLNSQDVLIPAFIAAYLGRPVDNNFSAFPRIPLPNWRVDYAGLTKYKWFKERFAAINITHSYASVFAVGNFRSSLQYDDEFVGLDQRLADYTFPNIAEENANGEQQWVPIFIIPQVTISERFAPLIGLDIRTKQKVTFRVSYNRERNVVLNLANAQITELNNENVVLGGGFAKSNMKLPFRVQGRQVVLKNELTLRADVTVGDTRTIQRQLDGLQQVTAGRLNFQFRPTVNYMINQRLNVQGYFERTINQPRVLTSFPQRATSFGIQVRYNLS